MNTMNKKFAQRLTEYLDSECSDFGMEYSWEWNEDSECCEVVITRDKNPEYSKALRFKYNEEKDDLHIELSEDSYYETREFDQTVKYFWMLVSPALFPNN